MGLYYLLLNQLPEPMAARSFLGWPLSLLLGVLVMWWGVCVALLFAWRERGQGEKYE